jgi:hypothetical protein
VTVAEIQTAANAGMRFRVSGYGGIAFYFRSVEIERFWDYDLGVYPEEPEERETGNVILVMVGDDREHSIDPDDVSALGENDYCHECGQIGCTHDGRDRD